MREIHHPALQDVPLSVFLHALSDPVRLSIVRKLALKGEQCCGSCGGDKAKATLSHHFKVLREAGLIRVRVEGTQRCISLRRQEIDTRFPHLLDAVLSAESGIVGP
jgi:DNA-binding transcriptional ArsR family regulator